MTCPRKKQGGYLASAGSGCLACFSGDSSGGAASPVFARFIGDTGAMEWVRLAVPWPRAPAAAPDRPAPSPRGCTPLQYLMVRSLHSHHSTPGMSQHMLWRLRYPLYAARRHSVHCQYNTPPDSHCSSGDFRDQRFDCHESYRLLQQE